MNDDLMNERLRLIKEIKSDEREIRIWRGLDDKKVESLERTIDRKLRLLETLKG